MVNNIALFPKALGASVIATEKLLNCSIRVFVLLKANRIFSNLLK
jgi:hypothetical protein